MSMISAQIDELRKSADEWNKSNMFELARMCSEAADTIWQLRDDLQRANDAVRDAEHDESRAWDRVRKAEAENAKLRELCATVIDDWMSKVCPSFPFCECGGEYQDCTDETCGNQIYRQMARELGVEVD